MKKFQKYLKFKKQTSPINRKPLFHKNKNDHQLFKFQNSSFKNVIQKRCITNLSVQKFLASKPPKQITIDVRSPIEYHSGHIPGSQNIPLFSDEERATVGIIYKKSGREKAILKGLDLIGPRLSSMVNSIKALHDTTSENDTINISVYCARGGMRSASLGWLLELFKYKVNILEGGYKSFRHYVLETFTNDFIQKIHPLSLNILGGKTGSGKTEILKKLEADYKYQIIDLEDLAKHKGSAYDQESSTQEHFENQLAIKWRECSPDRLVLVESESKRIGRCHIPSSIFDLMQESQLLYLDVPIEIRTQRLIEEYSTLPLELLETMTQRIEKRLGPQNRKDLSEFLKSKKWESVTLLLLERYYDSLYLKSLKQRKGPKFEIKTESGDPSFNANLIDNFLKNKD